MNNVDQPLPSVALSSDGARLFAVLTAAYAQISEAESRAELYRAVCNAACCEAGFELAWIARPDVKADRLVPEVCAGPATDSVNDLDARYDGSGSCGPAAIAIRDDRTVCVNDTDTDQLTASWRGIATRHGITSAVAVPIHEDDTPSGCLALYSKHSGTFTDPDIEVLSDIGRALESGLRVLSYRKRYAAAKSPDCAGQRSCIQDGNCTERDLLDRVMATCPVGVVLLDRDGAIAFATRKATEVLGLDTDAPLAPSFDSAEWNATTVDGEAIPADDLPFARVRRTRASIDGVRYTVERPDGRRVTLSVNAAPRFDECGTFLGAVFTVEDVTNLVRMETEYRKHGEDLERRVGERTTELRAVNRELESFSYSVSHDMRAPLRHISGYVEVLMEELADYADSEVQRHLKILRGSANEMGALIDALLRFSRMGRAHLEMAKIDMTRVVDSALRTLEPEIADRRIEWHIEELPSVWGDRRMIALAMTNLISNALKFTREREVAEIRIGSRCEDRGEALIFVRDNGTGFDMRYADKLFGVFQRLHRKGEFEGSGIGLANVRRIVERHGGLVFAEGAPGEGAEFAFTLPSASSRAIGTKGGG